LGAGIGGMSMAYEMRESARAEDKVTVISNLPYFSSRHPTPGGGELAQAHDITIPPHLISIKRTSTSSPSARRACIPIAIRSS